MFNGEITFAYPKVLYLLFIIPLIAFLFFKRGGAMFPKAAFSSLRYFSAVPRAWKERFYYIPFILRLSALSLFIIALARPQNILSGENIHAEGIDIVMVLDISGSMLAEDFSPNRLEAAKRVIDEFIQGRKDDKIGLVVFAGESFTQCPLTVDYSVLRNLLKDIKSGMITDGTAIGNSVANAVNRLKESEAKSKAIVLVTDGVNNAGEIDPLTASQIAETFGIRIYTIGVGAYGEAPYPFQTPMGIKYQMVPVEIDENLLKEMSKITDGKYYRASNNKKLKEIYEEIDKLEKSRIEVVSYKKAKELFYAWVGIGLLLLTFEVALANTLFRKIP